ncbi:MAG: NAD(P)H-hydrate dehydratase [Kouleothrix sp.]|nr:NAD(P)H-hydrate dehydratase [Kouleothrix sp.]
MRTLEQAAVDSGATWPGLMEQAGWGVAQQALRLLGNPAGRRVLALVGPGNNGGDGLVAARHLHDTGAQVALYLWRRRESDDDANWRRCRERGLPEHEASADPRRAQLRRLLADCDLVIDALLGMGISRPVEGELAEIVRTLNDEPRTKKSEFSAQRSAFSVLSVDMPTGVDSDSGAVRGAALRADITVATGLLKRGLLQYPGRLYAGAIRVVEIGLAPRHLEALMSETIDATLARGLLPRRPDDAHKGTFGKVMVIAGSAQYPGAASLATAGAARVGAGLVTLATSRGGLAGPGRLPEVTLQFLPDADWTSLGEDAAVEALKHLDGYQALLVGPGLGREDSTRKFLERLLGVELPKHRGHIGFRIGPVAEQPAEQPRPELPPTVIDADGLTLLSQIEGWWERLPRGRCVLTPHPGEMKRLLAADQLDGDDVKVAEQAAKAWGQIVVLKGATTVVADPEGRSAVNDGGNAALATAGTGDVLAGAIAGLLAQGLAPFDAAALGVYLHSAAGRLVRDDLGDMGTIASDLLPRLPLAIRQLKRES